MERQNELLRSNFMPTQFVRLVDVLGPFSKDLESYVGKPVQEFDGIPISPELLEVADQAHVSPFHIKRWTARLLTVDQNGTLVPNTEVPNVRLQLGYLQKFQENTPESLEDSVARKLDAHPKYGWALGPKVRNFPLLPGVTVDVLDQFNTGSNKQKRRNSWYGDVVDAVITGDQAAAEFMRKFKYRQNKIVGNSLVDRFLNDFEADLRLHIAEVLNAANAHAISSITSGHDGVVVHGMSLGVSRSDYADVIGELSSLTKPEPDADPSHVDTMFERIISRFIKYNEGLESETTAILPIIVGSYDISRYAQLLRDRMVELNQSLDQEKPYPDLQTRRGGNRTISSIPLDGRPSILLRPFPEFQNGKETAGARMAIKIGDLNFRADFEYHYGNLSLDMGHTDIEKVMQFLRGMHDVNAITPIYHPMRNVRAMNTFINRNSIGPSLMAPYGEPGDVYGWNNLFDESTKVAVMSSVVAGGGEDVGMRQKNGRFGYHMRENLNKSEYLENGPLIMYVLSRSLTSAAV